MADGSIIIDTKVDSSGAENGVKSLGKLGGMASNALGVATKTAAGMAVGITAATGAVVALTKASIEQYAQYEQLTGGVETLFKDSSNTVMQYANVAYKTAGLSANEYMNTITSFSASLLQGLGGDTKKAADIGNQAVIDMSDNANKMGTAMESIQNAYQGFAKQNYTMLDNLKLGYGGTKSEMERLLTDAEKISGIHYNISNFSDIIQAIHTIQEQMGITGTTTKEAMTTIEGSLNMTKAAWKNMLTGMADDKSDFDTLINNLVESVGALGENLMPRIGIALNGVGQLIDTLLPIVIDRIPGIIESSLPSILDSATNIVSALGSAMLESLPILADLAVQVITTLVQGLQTNMPQIGSTGAEVLAILLQGILETLPLLLDAGIQFVAYLGQGITEQLPTLIPCAMECVTGLVQAIIDNVSLIFDVGWSLLDGLAQGIINSIPILIEALPQIIEGIIEYFTTCFPKMIENGSNIILNLVNGIVDAIPSLIAMLPQIIDSIVQFITGNLPQIINTGIQVILALIDGFINALPQLIAMLPQIINSITTGLLNHLPELINAGIQIIVALAGGLLQAIPQLIGSIPTIVSSLFSAFTSVNWGEIGINIIKGIGSGITGAITGLVDVGIKACKSLKDSVCAFFDIHSPSRLMRDLVGKNIIAGISVGMQNELPNAINVAKGICSKLNNTFKQELNKENAQSYIDTIYNWGGSFAVLAEEMQNAKDSVEIANSKTVDDNKWYRDAKYRLEDAKSQLEELQEKISDTEDKSTKESLQKQQKVLQKQQKLIQKEVDYYKEASQQEIDTAKENAKQQLARAKEKYSKLEDLSKALTTAIKEQLNQQKEVTINSIKSEIDALETKYDKESDLIDSNTDKKKESIQNKIDALDQEAEAENRLKEIQESNNNIAVLQAKLNNTASEADKKALALKIKNSQAALEQKRKEWNREDEKASLKEEQDEIEKRAKKKKDRLKAEYEDEKENLKKKKKAAEEYYEKLLETDAINAQARYLMLQGSNDQLVQLLQSYNPYWQDAGQSLADSLINGLNSRKQDMASAVANLTSLRNGSLDGYSSGTSFNPKSGLYNVDENKFELSTGNAPVAYVSKGAGILNHMQSLGAIKEEVKAQVGTFANKLRSAVMADQYRMGQLAMATTNNSYGGNVDNSTSYGGHLLNVEHMEIRNESDIPKLAHELESYKQRKKK
ncbi:phage tail tape measure protein [Clostridium botulinum]|uniref:Phage tail tape measure protein n=1 Tax=Clostridium botulinum TaxID=1491 RepID=A0A6B4JR83_CLOBO|nr:hypothetical protein [Clostridium botulinum]EES48316.1 conserved hypothetical protein [Clostridium botulinum E1 str. 'BoNT E Beluga']MBY6762830.1 phage tail tape measure protein [Clostridium botulinum]MBY6921614.1 phage tail tape measure protein [Clostridium botulinum]MCR1132816.1 phage tail tape measure protein [Clostridium botulinum]NFH70763.1 phage tail tape measure protein [Clostridium botulinum]